LSKEIEYYNDEELDRFRDKSSGDYTEEETEEFREVLMTMKESEVPGWVRSLQLRGIEIPDDLKDEIVMIVSERRKG
jgi:MoxR-like ATPase